MVADEDVLCCVASAGLDPDELMYAFDGAAAGVLLLRVRVSVDEVPVLADALRSSAAVLPAVGALFGVP